MPRLGLLVLLILLCAVSLFAQSTKNDTKFPTDSDIKLMLAQADSAMSSYQKLIESQPAALGKNEDSIVQGRAIVLKFEQYFPAFKEKPDTFNSPVGFLLLSDLHTASRMMVACVMQDLLLSNVKSLGTTRLDASDLQLARSCSDVLLSLFTAAESATQLRAYCGLQPILIRGNVRDG